VVSLLFKIDKDLALLTFLVINDIILIFPKLLNGKIVISQILS